MGPGVVERFVDGGGRAPLIVRPRGAASPEGLAELVAARRHDLHERLAWVGAVLFRGFGVADARGVACVVRAFSDRAPRPYHGGGARRTPVGDGVYSATAAPARARIPLHSELSHLPAHPRHLFFACARAATRGGETTLADTRAVLAALPSPVRERFITRGVRYVRELPSGDLETSTVRPAVITHAVTGERIWFNQAHLFGFRRRWIERACEALATLLQPRRVRGHHAQYGDGGDIEPVALAQVLATLDRQTIACAWQRGDLLVVDNETCMHGRNPFSGARRVLVAMTG